MKNSKIGFLGAGNIAYAIVRGVLASGYLTPDQIYLYDLHESSFDKFDSLGVHYTHSTDELLNDCNFLFFTVKPQVCSAVLQEIACAFNMQQCIISVCAGIPISFFQSTLGNDAKIVRVMPNTPLLVGEGASALAFGTAVSQEEREFVQGIFKACGTTQVVAEETMSAVTAVSGSGPAYFFYLTEKVCDWAQKNGLDQQIALQLFCQTMQGAAQMMLQSSEPPEQLRKAVTSPHGTTQEALQAFDQSGFDKAFLLGLDACKKRSDELSTLK